jgi:exopolysaccharide biosynthesis WecB/TagA/CpsF family protein
VNGLARVLIVQIADIGDLVLSTPALAALRESHPNAHIAVLTTPHAAPILRHTALADAVLTVPRGTRPTDPALLALVRRLRAGRYDAVLYFHHFSTRSGALKHAAVACATGAPIRVGLDNGSAPFLTHTLPDQGFGALHQAQYWLNLAGLVGANADPRPAQVGISDADRVWAAARLPDGASYLGVHAGSGGFSLARRWDAGKWAAAANQVAAEMGAAVVLVGGSGDDNAAVASALTVPCLDLTGQTTLNQLAAVLARCRLFLGADSGVMHVAAAAGAPVVAVFGSSNAAAWRPWLPESRSVVVQQPLECAPCSYVGTGVGARDGCPARTCLRTLTVERVVEAGRRLAASADSRHAGYPLGLGGGQPDDRLRLLGCPISAVTFESWLEAVETWVEAGGFHHVVTLNPEMIMIAQRDPIFYQIVRRADVTLADGVGLLLAARWRGRPLPARVTGSDGVPKLAERAALRGWRLFLLGAAEGVAQQAADVLCARYPGLQIAGVYSGSPLPAEEDGIVARVNAARADILLVAYGAPEQDKWIARQSARLNVAMAMGVGGTFDFIAGIVPRAPEAWRRLGVEWLYRLIRQPWRWRRMLRLPLFVLRVWLKRTP